MEPDTLWMDIDDDRLVMIMYKEMPSIPPFY
jgi:hypothetical protein